MKRVTVLLLGSLITLTAAVAAAAGATDVRPYVSAHIGAAITPDSSLTGGGNMSYDIGFGTGAALGLDFDRMRVEIEFDYKNSGISEISATPGASGEFMLYDYLLNAYYTFPLDSELKPFLTAGAGFATASVGDITTGSGKVFNRNSNTQFAYQAGAGVSYELKRDVALDLSYRYLGTSDFDFQGTKLGYGVHNTLLTLRHSF